MNLVERIDATIAAIDRLHEQRHRPHIAAYCRRIGQLLDAATAALDHLTASSAESGNQSAEAHYHELGRWASRVAAQIDEAALVRCDPRIEQSLSDLVMMLRAAVRAQQRQAPHAEPSPG